MMKAVLKTLVVSFGGGLALGAGIRLAQGGKTREQPEPALDPLIARLKDVESRILAMEAGAPAPAAASVPPSDFAAFESRLAGQVADVQQLRGEVRSVDRRLNELDAEIPVVVQSAVEVRFQEVERRLRQEFEEAQSRSIAAFVDTLQTRVVERMNTLETNLSEQSAAIGKLRDTSLRTDENLQKMLVGIERLVGQSRPPEPPLTPPSAPVTPASTRSVEARTDAQTASAPVESAVHMEAAPAAVPSITAEVPGGIPASPAPADEVVLPPVPALLPAAPPPVAESSPVDEPPAGETLEEEESYEWINRIGLELLAPRPRVRPRWHVPLALGATAGLVLLAAVFYSGILQRYSEPAAPQQTAGLISTAGDVRSRDRVASKAADPAALVELGHEYARRQDWVRAEAAYRAALDTSPRNQDAATGLSDVLYQQRKYEESAAVLNRLASANSQN